MRLLVLFFRVLGLKDSKQLRQSPKEQRVSLARIYLTEKILIDIFAAIFVRYLLLFSVKYLLLFSVKYLLLFSLRYLQLSCAALSWATDDTMEMTEEILGHLQFIRYCPDH